MKKFRQVSAVAGLVLCGATAALAATSVSISSVGKGVFTVNGSDFNGVAGAKITIAYDAATMGNPRVTQGGLVSDAMMATNTAVPGTVTLALIQAKGVTGSGEVATITFDLRGASRGVIQSQTVDLVNAGGARIAAASEIANPEATASSAPTGDTPASPVTAGGQPEQTATLPQAPSPATAGAASAPATVRTLAGGLAVPETETAAVNRPAEEAVAVAVSPRGEGTPPVATGSEEAGRPARDNVVSAAAEKGVPGDGAHDARYQGVLERFRTQQGAKTPATLTALFDVSAARGIRQEPPVALSDGSTKVKLSVELTSGKAAPSFAVDNASVVSVTRNGAATWVVEALPAKGVATATVILLQNGVMTEIPLTVAPPLPGEAKLGTAGALTVTDFTRFLGERGTKAAPKYDLNHDGVRDYVDDYIFTANYLVAAGRGEKVTKEPK